MTKQVRFLWLACFTLCFVGWRARVCGTVGVHTHNDVIEKLSSVWGYLVETCHLCHHPGGPERGETPSLKSFL